MTEIEITLTGLSSLQATIADFLWAAQSSEDMADIYLIFPQDQVDLVKDLMFLAALDGQDGTELAAEALRGIGLL